ncbi:hypothetical protein AXK61_04250 [Tsukamurella pseudospumae]|uniref:non-specific serine/threonine protein kinase n=1 Tax=Tsukamurella pseudospumae TaxID=239498 RepID=A0A137ZCH2_9ACTN|nr:hypothetical protein AXK61_04250 [Tsukamurella pseudospumae]
MIEPGTTFAGYVIERTLGAGGMGEVYVGRHPRLPRSDAIKVLGAQVSGDEQFQARFHREAELAAGLSHPAIVQVYDQGEDDGRLWISMQLIDGRDVGKLAAAGPIPVPEVARIISTVADALDFAGARGLVHRDVKPANILVSEAGHVMLTDFGIARMGAEASDLTGTGMTVGTLNYASPEQLQGETVDTRSDQYSLAATAYHLLAGTPPFADSNAVKVITGHLGSPVPSLATRRPGFSSEVDAVLGRGLAKDPTHRFASSREFAAALQSALLSGHSDVTLHAPHASAGFAPLMAPPAGVVPSPPPIPRPTVPPARGSWLVSAAVIMVAALILGIGRQLAWTQSTWFFVASAFACLGVAGYVGSTGLSLGRRYIAASMFVLLGIGWALQVSLPSNVIAVVAALLAPTAWGVARRRGGRWAWSLLATPLLFVGGFAAMTVLDRSIGLSFGSWLAVWFVLVFTLPLVLVGLLGWLIDWLQHRRESSPSALSNPGNGTFDPTGPTQLRG